MPPGASSPSSGSSPTPSGGGASASAAGGGSTPPPPIPTQPVSRAIGRPESRSAHRAAKRAATGRPPAGTPRRQARSSGTNWAIVGLAGAAALVGAAVVVFGNPFGTPTPSASAGASAAASGVSPYGNGTCPTSQPAELPAGESRLVTIATELGDIVIRVDGALSPIAAGNFVALAECEYYDGVVFHRTAALEGGIPFVIQGGDPDGTGRGGPGYTIRDEPVTTSYHRGTVAMARSQGVDTQGSQFFIVLDDRAAPVLSSANTYAIFGEVVSGMEVADAIYQASNGVENPADPVVMNTVTVEDAAAPSASPAASAASAAPSASPITTPATSP